MSYQVFARKYRPRTFADLLGQDHVVRTLRNAIAKDRIAQAYLFVGPRGTGKTSTARILAKALNNPGGPSADFDPDAELCREIAEGRSLDVLEIDGASNNGVDQIRDLRETVQYAPAQARFKVYYIDEVHMLSNAAFNALLKTLEEPPPHVKFIFATTEPQKILPTIISRCQRFDLRRIPDDIIAQHLLHIAELEQITLQQAAAAAIARGAEGGMRDAQSMLDQLVAFCGETITEHDVEEVFGITSWETVANLARQLLELDSAEALATLHHHHEAGRDLSRLLADLIRHWRNLIVWQVDGGQSLNQVEPAVTTLLAEQAQLRDSEHLLLAADELASTLEKMRWASDPHLQAELGLIRTLRALESVSLDDVLGFLEKRGADPQRAPGHRPTAKAEAIVATASTTASNATTPSVPDPSPRSTKAEAQVNHGSIEAPRSSGINESEPTDSTVDLTPQPPAADPAATSPEPPSLSWDAPLRNALPEIEEGEEAPENYDDRNDYGSESMFDLLAADPVSPAEKAEPNAAQPAPAEVVATVAITPISLDDLNHFWQTFTHQLPPSLGMIIDTVIHGLPLSLKNDHLIIGLPPSQSFVYDAKLRKPGADLLAALAAATGRPLTLEFVLDDSVPEPVIPEPEPLPKPAEASAKKSSPAKTPPAAQAAPSNPARRFADDPDIERALKLFEAEVLED